jgi:CMP-N,N'-diacetyllegionaminic acid synthase
MNILFTVCGRGGSKGVKSKNLILLYGKPLLHYTLLFCEQFKNNLTSDNIDFVVSSDDQNILIYSKEFKSAIQRERDINLAKDDTPKIPVIIDALNYVESLREIKYDYVIDLDITSPLRKPSDVLRAINILSNTKFDLVFSAVESRRNPYFNMVEIDGDQFASRVKSSNFTSRQQAPKVYDMNASIYCFRRSKLETVIKNSSFEGYSTLIEMEDTYVLDIDKPMDFEIFKILVDNYFKSFYSELFS